MGTLTLSSTLGNSTDVKISKQQKDCRIPAEWSALILIKKIVFCEIVFVFETRSKDQSWP